MPASSTSLAVTKPLRHHQRVALRLRSRSSRSPPPGTRRWRAPAPWRPGSRPRPPPSRRARRPPPRARAPPRPRGRSAPCCPGRSSAGWRSPGCRTRPWASTTGCPGTDWDRSHSVSPLTTVCTSPGRRLAGVPASWAPSAPGRPAHRPRRRPRRPRSHRPRGLGGLARSLRRRSIAWALRVSRPRRCDGEGHDERGQDPGAHRETSFRAATCERDASRCSACVAAAVPGNWVMTRV